MGPPVAVGETIELAITGLAAGGDGVGRHGGYALFVPFTAPGDRARVVVEAAGPRFGRGRLVEVLSAGPERVAPGCPYFMVCGGCQLQHLAYPAQLAAKRQLLADALQRLGHLAVAVGQAVASRPHWHYRNATQFTATMTPEGFGLGFLKHHSHEVLPVDHCPISHGAINHVLGAARELLLGDFAELGPAVAGLTVRHSEATGEDLAIIHQHAGAQLGGLARALRERAPTLAGVLAGSSRRASGGPVHLHLVEGRGHLEQHLGRLAYRVSAGSFFQVNSPVAAELVQLVLELVDPQPGETVLDAYAGVGTLALPLAAVTGKAVIIEQERAALADARRNLAAVPELRVLEGAVEKRLPAFARGGGRADIVVLDPPRKGCGELVLRAAAALRPRVVVLVSCDPATMARDLALLARLGYPPQGVTPLDMFPQTWHVEGVAACRRG